jgi:cytochrome c5
VGQPKRSLSACAMLICALVLILGVGIALSPVRGHAQSVRAAGAPLYAWQGAAPSQDAGTAQPATDPAKPAPAKIELPEGDGKPIATEFCQDCHKLTNLASAHKSLEDWKDTVQMMMDRGSRLPPDKVDTLVQYLAKNFAPGHAAPAATPASGAPADPAAPSATPPPAKQVLELPDGDGKAIATEFCQDCHKLTNLTTAHKSLGDWKDTVQMMRDRGSRLPPDKVDTLVQYLAKNFTPAN